MKCEKCGNINPEGQLDCIECGGPLGELVQGIDTGLDPITEPLVDIVSNGGEEEDVEPVVEAAADSNKQPETSMPVYTEDKSHRKSNKVFIGVILLLLIGALIAVYFNRDKLKPKSENPSAAVTEETVVPEPITGVSNKETIITLNDEPIAKSVFALYFWITQQRFESAGPNVWDTAPGEDGINIVDIAKENTVKDIKLAIAAKQKLDELKIIITDEETKEVYTQANDIMTNNVDLAPMLQVDLSDMEQFILHGLYVQKAMDAVAETYTPTEEEINAQVAQVQAKYETATVKHVLIASKDEKAKALAEEVLKKALAGEDMAALAKTYSEDPGSKDTGGEYKEFPKGQMVPEFEEAAFTGEIGKVYPKLVETSYGYHIIKVEARATGDSAQIKKDSEQAAKYQYAQVEITKLSETVTVKTTDLYDKLEIIK